LTLLTTGLLLSRHAQDVAAMFEDVIVSLDGPREIHDSIRRVKGAYEAIASGIAAVRSLRPGLRISARMTVQKANHTSLQASVTSAKELRLDAISFLAADLTSEAFNRTLIWPVERQDEIGLNHREVKVLEAEVEELITNFADEIRAGYIAEGPAKLRKIVAHFRAHLGVGEYQSPRCNAPWVSAVIETDGSVRPCFFHHPIGNLAGASLEEVVNGEAAIAFRERLDVAEDPICRRCVCSLHRSRS
jgi:MoaA/NifB/PqqE/SkfB family radical SAM enzyme